MDMKNKAVVVDNQKTEDGVTQKPTFIGRGAAIQGLDLEFMTVKEAAIFMRVSKSYLDKLRCTGGGPQFIRAGVRKILYRKGDLVGWMRARHFDSTSQYDE